MIDLFTPLKSSRLSVIVPVFNEAQNILKNLDLLISEIEPYFLTYEILVVSDGSTDGTHQILQQVEHPNVRTIAFTRNKGKGHAVREGFKEARGDYILFIDGGMELHPRDIRVFLGLMELYRADIVIGSKRHPQSQVDYPVLRRILSSIYQLLIRKVFHLNVTDTQVGLKLFRKAVIDAILPELTIDRYGFDLEILALARSKGFQLMLEAPIRLEYFNHNTRSTLLELVHVFKVGSIILMDTYRLARRLRDPLKTQITSQRPGSGNSP